LARLGFGTDGVRGVANVQLTAELATAIGRAAVRVLGAPCVVVGRDTRQSSPMLQAALAAGMASEGADVVDLGVLPTAGVAFVAAQRGVPAAMISASHNPYTDNGIKLFGPNGIKLSPALEDRVEEALEAVPGSGAVGSLSTDLGTAADYRDHLVASLDGRRLEGLQVVVDCANGAACEVAPGVLESLGATVRVICANPDGTNINAACGSTHPSRLAETVTATRSDLGLALDGDADRLVAVDHEGRVRDGDELLAIFAVDLAARDDLPGRAVVVTVMTNLGFRHAMATRGIEVHETPVGDRQVLVALDDKGLALGGEQSGHIVFRRRATTGDGVLTGILLADTVVRTGRSLSDLADGLVTRVPQVLVNVSVPDPAPLADARAVWDEVAAVEEELGDRGRVLLRASGTEPLVRVMVEAPTPELAAEAAARLRAAVERWRMAG